MPEITVERYEPTAAGLRITEGGLVRPTSFEVHTEEAGIALDWLIGALRHLALVVFEVEASGLVVSGRAYVASVLLSRSGRSIRLKTSGPIAAHRVY